jgi:hypothetical protein
MDVHLFPILYSPIIFFLNVFLSHCVVQWLAADAGRIFSSADRGDFSNDLVSGAV